MPSPPRGLRAALAVWTRRLAIPARLAARLGAGKTGAKTSRKFHKVSQSFTISALCPAGRLRPPRPRPLLSARGGSAFHEEPDRGSTPGYGSDTETRQGGVIRPALRPSSQSSIRASSQQPSPPAPPQSAARGGAHSGALAASGYGLSDAERAEQRPQTSGNAPHVLPARSGSLFGLRGSARNSMLAAAAALILPGRSAGGAQAVVSPTVGAKGFLYPTDGDDSPSGVQRQNSGGTGPQRLGSGGSTPATQRLGSGGSTVSGQRQNSSGSSAANAGVANRAAGVASSGRERSFDGGSRPLVVDKLPAISGAAAPSSISSRSPSTGSNRG